MSSSVSAHSLRVRYVDFGCGEPGAVVLAEIRERFRVADDLLDARAVGPREAPRDGDGQEAPAPPHVDDEAPEITGRQVAAGERRAVRPAARADAERVLQFFEHGFGEAPVGRQLAAEDRQERRLSGRLRQFDSIVARDARCARRRVVPERPHAGVRPAHVAGGDRALEVAVDRVAQIADLVVGDAHVRRVAGERHVGRADQRPLLFVRNREHDPPVGILQHERMLAGEQPRHDDVAALHEPHAAVDAHGRQAISEPAPPRGRPH